MNQEQLNAQERINTGTAKTKNLSFEQNGYLIIRGLWDPKELIDDVPEERGQFNYWGKQTDQFIYRPEELQVQGSVARYWHPKYREIHSGIRNKIEKYLLKDLYNTYYYDRFYFPGQELTKHVDRDACEISVTVHIGTNLKGAAADWPICIKTPDVYEDKQKSKVKTPGKEHSVVLKPGDGMVYKGCERPHWREPMPNNPSKLFDRFKKQKEIVYYHQIFFHYVLQDGRRAQCAFDATK